MGSGNNLVNGIKKPIMLYVCFGMRRFIQVLLNVVAITPLVLTSACSDDSTSPHIIAEVKHFKKAHELYFDANHYLRDITEGGSVVGSMSEKELNTFVKKLSDALREARGVSDITLREIHPGLPAAYHSIFIPCIEKQIRGFRDFDPKASIEGQELHNVWIDWWNSHVKSFTRF